MSVLSEEPTEEHWTMSKTKSVQRSMMQAKP